MGDLLLGMLMDLTLICVIASAITLVSIGASRLAYGAAPWGKWLTVLPTACLWVGVIFAAAYLAMGLLIIDIDSLAAVVAAAFLAAEGVLAWAIARWAMGRVFSTQRG